MHERNGNDASIVRNLVEGHVIYFKSDYGFIRPDEKTFDDIFFHVKDVEPWREGFIEFKGRVKEQRMIDEEKKEILIPYYPGERVKFDIKDSQKIFTDRFGVKKKGYKAINVEILSEYKPKTFTKK